MMLWIANGAVVILAAFGLWLLAEAINKLSGRDEE